MWVLTSFFAITTIALAWLCAGYFILLRFSSFLRRQRTVPLPDSLPTLSIVVPCYNEQDLILAKLENLLTSDYPADKMEIVFVDGGSTDATVARLRAHIPIGRGVRVSQSPRKGKINQLNYVLPTLAGRYVVITDADGIMQRDTLRYLVAEFHNDERVRAVGAFSHVKNAIWRDRCFWDSQNRGRLIESDANSSSIVIATCYAFRSDLLTEFPDDVIADDVYVGFLANSQAYRVVYSRHAIVEELRGPAHKSEFYSHKFRKTNAFLRESLRFLHRLPDMTGFGKTMALTRIGQQLLLPWAVALWSLLALTLLTLGRLDLLVVAVATLMLTVIIASQAFRSVDVPAGTSGRYGALKQGTVFFETLLLLIAAALSYPFFRQTSSYARLGGGAECGDEPSDTQTTDEIRAETRPWASASVPEGIISAPTPLEAMQTSR